MKHSASDTADPQDKVVLPTEDMQDLLATLVAEMLVQSRGAAINVHLVNGMTAFLSSAAFTARVTKASQQLMSKKRAEIVLTTMSKIAIWQRHFDPSSTFIFSYGAPSKFSDSDLEYRLKIGLTAALSHQMQVHPAKALREVDHSGGARAAVAATQADPVEDLDPIHREQWNTAVKRGIEANRDLETRVGRCLSAEDFAKLIGITSRQQVNNLRKGGKIIGLPKGANHFVYPSYLAFQNQPLPGLEDIITAVRKAGGNDRDILRFLLSPADALGGMRPLDACQTGKKEDAIRAARSLLQP